MLSGFAGTALRRFSSLFHRNRDQPGPLPSGQIIPLNIPLPSDENTGFRPYPVFSGLTNSGSLLSAHISVLSPGKIPHPPHTHKEEEILILLYGALDLITTGEGENSSFGRMHLEPGHVLFYPQYFSHTIQSVGQVPANYLMLKWIAPLHTHGPMLGFGHYIVPKFERDPTDTKGYRSEVLFEGSTRILQKLHCHISLLDPGARIKSHTDPYDVVIIVLEGELETLRKRIKPSGVIFYASGKSHALYNSGEQPARYIVIEFHW